MKKDLGPGLGKAISTQSHEMRLWDTINSSGEDHENSSPSSSDAIYHSENPWARKQQPANMPVGSLSAKIYTRENYQFYSITIETKCNLFNKADIEQ